MKKKTITIGVMLFASISVFGQKQETVMPRFNSDAEKAEWIMTHPDDYERMTGEKVSSVVPEFKTQEEKDAWLKSLQPVKEEGARIGIDDPTFPVYVDTGNPELDYANYINAKEAWILKNPLKYEQISTPTDSEEGMTREERLIKHNIKN
jgi:hypothetical protein